MRIVTREKVFRASPEIVWAKLTELKKVPHYTPFVVKIWGDTSLEIGSRWYDLTTILYMPLRFTHIMTAHEKHKKLAFSVHPMLGGEMVQEYILESQGKGTKAVGSISFRFHSRLHDRVLGEFLEKRLGHMLEGGMENLAATLNN